MKTQKEMKIKKIKLIYRYKTIGKYRLLLKEDSVKEIINEKDFETIINNKISIGEEDWESWWKFTEIKRKWNDTNKNYNRYCIYEFTPKNNKIYIIRRRIVHHLSRNKNKLYSGCIFYLVKAGKIVETVNKLSQGI